jgi:hypothetical protein
MQRGRPCGTISSFSWLMGSPAAHTNLYLSFVPITMKHLTMGKKLRTAEVSLLLLLLIDTELILICNDKIRLPYLFIL